MNKTSWTYSIYRLGDDCEVKKKKNIGKLSFRRKKGKKENDIKHVYLTKDQ